MSFRLVLCTVLLIAACGDDTLANGNAGGGATQDSVAACKADVMASVQRVEECVEIDPSKVEQALAACEKPAPERPRALWCREFRDLVDACGETLTCEDFAEDLDDICFPLALEQLAAGLLHPSIVDGCILGGTDDCRAALWASTDDNPSAVARCLRLWGRCSDEEQLAGDAFFTEDHCGTIIALVDDARSAAAECLDLPCGQVGGCLRAAGAFGF